MIMLANEPLFLRQIEGVLLSQLAGINSKYGKDVFLENAIKYYNKATIKKMKRKLVVLPPGIDLREVDSFKIKNKFCKKTIVFNHRLLRYTGYKTFLNWMCELYKKRQDFQVILTDPSLEYSKSLVSRLRTRRKFENQQFILPMNTLDREEYFKILWKADIEVACHRHAAWSLGLLDGMACRKVALAPNACAFPEILGSNYPFLFSNKIDFLKKLEYLLDSSKERRKWGNYCRFRVAEQFDWANLVNDYIKLLEDAKPPITAKNPPTVQRIAQYVEKRGRATKKEIISHFHLGYQVPWSAYKHLLLKRGFVDDFSLSEATLCSHKDSN